jgi:hypothetical protein
LSWNLEERVFSSDVEYTFALTEYFVFMRIELICKKEFKNVGYVVGAGRLFLSDFVSLAKPWTPKKSWPSTQYSI